MEVDDPQSKDRGGVEGITGKIIAEVGDDPNQLSRPIKAAHLEMTTSIIYSITVSAPITPAEPLPTLPEILHGSVQWWWPTHSQE